MEFVLNASYDELLSWLGRASVGISSMIDEHFGINIVEFMVSMMRIVSIFSLICESLTRPQD